MMNNTVLEWPPHYVIRHSKRAKYLKLHIDARQGLILVLPVGVSKRAGRHFLESKRTWIEKHAAILLSKYRAPPP